MWYLFFARSTGAEYSGFQVQFQAQFQMQVLVQFQVECTETKNNNTTNQILAHTVPCHADCAVPTVPCRPCRAAPCRSVPNAGRPPSRAVPCRKPKPHRAMPNAQAVPGYQIHFSNFSHNATWKIHHMYVGYQICFSDFLIMQPGGIITCMLVTNSISLICLIMQPGEISSHVCWLPNPFLEIFS